MQGSYYQTFTIRVQKAFQTNYPIFLMLTRQKREQIISGLWQLLSDEGQQGEMKIREYLATIYFNDDVLVDKFIVDLKAATGTGANNNNKVKQRTYEQFSRKCITTFQFIYPVFKVFQRTKQQDILTKLYVHAQKPNDDRIKQILSAIYLNDETLQNEFIEQVYYQGMNNQDQYATNNYDTYNMNMLDYHNQHGDEQMLQLANQEEMFQQYQQRHQQLIMQIQQIGCPQILQSRIRVQQLITLQRQCPQLQRFSHELDKQSIIGNNNVQEIKKLLQSYRFDQKIMGYVNKIQAPNISRKEKILLWRRIREQIQVLNIHQVYRSKEKITQELQQIKDKDGILIAGISGVGKTTFFLKMAGVKLRKIVQNKFCQQYQAQDPQLAKQFKISSRSVSCTKQPGVLIPKAQHTDGKKIVLIDTAGFEDSRSSQIDIINNLGTMKYIEQLRTLRIVIILSRHILGQRCSGLKRFGRLVASYFRNFRDVQQAIAYVLTKNLTIQQLSQAVENILKEIQAASSNSFDGYNYGFFFYHLKDQLDNQNVKEFHPNKCYVKEFLSLYIMKKQPLYNPAEYLNAAFSLESLQKIKRKSHYLQKMIIQTYKKRQFTMTSYYMNLLQKLQNLDERNTQLDLLYKCHSYIQQQNGQLSKKYESLINKFFQTGYSDFLQNAQKIKQIARQAQILKDPSQQRKYAYEYICEIASIKVDEIISSFSKKQQLQRQKHTSSSSHHNISPTIIHGSNGIGVYFRASLEFLKLQNKQLYQKICTLMDQDREGMVAKLKKLLQQKVIDQQQWREMFAKFIDFYYYKDQPTREDKRVIRIRQIAKIISQRLNQGEQQNILKIIQFGYESVFDGQLSQVKNYLQKLMAIEQSCEELKQVVEGHFVKITAQLKKLVKTYITIHKQSVIPFQSNKFKKLKIYQQNYDAVMEVLSIVQDSQIIDFHYRIGMVEYAKNVRNSLQLIIDQLNKEINSCYRDFGLINTRRIKRLFHQLKMHRQFMYEIHTQYKHIPTIEQTAKDSQRTVSRFLQKLQKRASKQLVKGFEINYKLLVDLVMIQQLVQMEQNESDRQKCQEMVDGVMGKLLAPVGRMVEVVDSFEEIFGIRQNGMTNNGFMNGQQQQQQQAALMASQISHSSKFNSNTILATNASNITIMDEYQTLKLYKLLEYVRKLNQLLQQLQDQRNMPFETTISYTENQQLKHILTQYFTRKQQQYNLLCPLIMWNNQQLNILGQHHNHTTTGNANNNKVREMRRVFNYRLKQNCIRYIKSTAILQRVCHEYQAIDVVEEFQRDKLYVLNLRVKIQSRLQRISRDFDLNQAENFTLKQLKDAFYQYLFLNQIYEDTQNYAHSINNSQYAFNTRKKSFNSVQLRIEKFMKRHYSDWRTLFAYLQRQLTENQLNIEFQQLVHLYSKQAMKIQANQKQFYTLLQKIDKVINSKLNHIGSNFVDCEMQQKYEVIQKICQFKSTATKINYKPTFRQQLFQQAYVKYFDQLVQQFDRIRKRIQEGVFVPQKQRNRLFSSQMKIQMLLKQQYGLYLQQKYGTMKPLREDFEQYSKQIMDELKSKYLRDDIKLDEKFSEFYRKTNKQNQQQIDKSLAKMYQNCQKQLVILARQDRAKYEAKIKQLEQMIQLMPQRKRIQYQKRLNVKNKDILKQQDEMLTKANQFKQKKDVAKILSQLDKSTRMKHQQMIDKTVRIIRDYFDQETRSINPKSLALVEQLLVRNVTKLQAQRAWGQLKIVYPQLGERYQEFTLQLQQKVVLEFTNIVQKIQAMPNKYLSANFNQSYVYHVVEKHQQSQQLVMKLIELFGLILKFQEFFVQRMQQILLSLTKLLENNKDNLTENLSRLNQHVVELKKSKLIPEQAYVKNIVLGTINSYLMKLLKQTIQKLSSQKRRKDLLQLIEPKLITEYTELITSIIQLIQQKLQLMSSFSIKKQLPTLPVDQILTMLKNKENQTKILTLNIKLFKLSKIPANWLQEVKNSYYNQYVEYEKINQQIVQKSFQNVTIQNQEQVRQFLKIRSVLQQNKFSFFPISAKTKNVASLIQQRTEQLKAKVVEFYSGRNSKLQYEQMIKQSQKLRQQQLQKINAIEQQQQRQQKKIRESIVQQMQRQMRKVPQNDKRIQTLQKIKKQFQTKKSSKLNDLIVRSKLQTQNIQKKYGKLLQPLDRRIIAFLEFNLINYMIIYRKNVSTYNFVDKIHQQQESKFITSQLQNIKRVYGTLTIKKIYDILCNHDNQYGQMIKNEQKMFQTYQKRVFKQLTQTQDIHYLFKNIKQIAENIKTKNLLQQKYIRYEKTYNQCIHKYEKNGGTELARKDIIEQTLRLANQIKQQYEKGVYSNSNKQDLMAHIFAVWSIIKSSTNQDYQIEFVYQPHPAQILAIFLLLGLDNPKKTGQQKVQKCMVQISTGEGKSVVLAGLSVFLALVGFDVYEACYSKYLSERDYKQFQVLFDTLNIKPKIKYNIFPEICRQVLNQSQQQTFNQKVHNILTSGGIAKNMQTYFSNLISNTKKSAKSILIIDQADVFINRQFLGEVYSPSVNLVGENVNKMLDYIWTLRDSSPHPDVVFQSAEFLAMNKQLPHFVDVFRNQVHAMLRGLKNFKSDSYKVIEDKIFYKQGDGLSALIHHGYRTIFAYYHEHFINQQISYESFRKMISINLIIAHFSYSRLPQYFDSILGVTGTLQHISKGQKRIMEEQYSVKKTYIMPSIYGLNSRRVVEFQKVHSLKLYAAIVANIEQIHRKKRPIIVFFKSKGQVNDFFDSKQFLPFKQSACRVTHEDSAKQRDFRVQTSTFEGKITIMTSDFSRGTDFKLNVKNINQHQGLHVIQAFMPQSLCDYIQLIGRTGRQGKNGSVVIFAVQSEKQQQKVSLSVKQGQSMIEKADNNKWNQQFQQIKNRILKANKSHQQSIRLYTKSKTIQQIIKKIYEFNEQPLIRDLVCKSVIALDGTSSMQSVFNKVKDVIKQAFPRLYDTLKHRKINGSFEIKICVYRNYNSRPQLLLQKTNFQTRSADLIEFLNKIRVDGGWGNQAIEVCFNHVNSLPQVDQIIIIGDAAANSKHETKSRRASKKISWEEKGYPDTNIQIQTQSLIQRKIEVHSYYLAAEKYFKKLSEETGGVAEFFEIRNPEAVENFTNFISLRILGKLEELSGESGDLVKYYQEKYVKKRYI